MLCYAGPVLMKNPEQQMRTEELLSKLDVIEEQARLTIDEFPEHLAVERQRMIIALAKQLRSVLFDSHRGEPDDPEATVRLPSCDARPPHSAWRWRRSPSRA